MCDTCHDTGFVLSGMDAVYCGCEHGQQLKEAHEMALSLKMGMKIKKTRAKKEWLPYREPGEEG